MNLQQAYELDLARQKIDLTNIKPRAA